MAEASLALSVTVHDSRLACAADRLRERGIRCTHQDLQSLAGAIRDGSASAALIDVETLGEADWHLVDAAIEAQPVWSALPFLLVIGRDQVPAFSGQIERLVNATVIELPLCPEMLDLAVRSAFRARQRQRRSAEALARSQGMEAKLEAQVRARTADLLEVNRKLVREVAERRRIEMELRESEEMYRYTVELSHQLAWTASTSLEIQTITATFREITGLPESTDPHRGWMEVMHPDDIAPTLATWQRARDQRRAATAEFRMRVADGSYRTFLARAAPRLNEHGEIVRWYGYTEDIQHQKEAEDARRSAEERYRLAARATNDAIWEFVPDSNVVQWSETAGRALGLGDVKLGTTSMAWWSDRIHPDDREEAFGTLEQAVQKEDERWTCTYRFRWPNGEYRTYFDRGFIMRDENRRPVRVVGAMSDITAQQRAQEEISRMQAELIHVSRLSAMGTMASTLAHELNQPLTVVTNYLRGIRRLAEADNLDVEGFRHALMLAESGALRAGQIVRRLRELVARGTAAMRREELPKLIEDAGVIAFLDAHVAGVVPQIELDPDARFVDADRIQIQQVIINLARNALQAVQGSERREIAIRTRRIAPDQVRVCVEDSGSGLSPKVRDELFSPFQSTKPDGLGIGLSISRTIIEAHGGKIWAEDRESGGTVFCFTLPSADADR